MLCGLAMQQRFMATAHVFNFANTLFSIFVMYFIHLYSAQQEGAGWNFLAIASKVYLIIVIGVFLIMIFAIIASSLAAFSLWLGWLARRR
jgi:uncharacterized membrane protein YozB (DUF420 family)